MREQIINDLLQVLTNTEKFKDIRRVLPTLDELQSIPVSNMPVACVNAGLPRPVYTSRNQKDYKTVIKVDLIFYMLVIDDDSQLSEMFESFWQELNSYEFTTKVYYPKIIQANYVYVLPYIIATVTLEIEYVASRGEI